MRTGISVGMLFVACAFTAGAAFSAEPPPVEAYGKLPLMTEARMSPDGTMVAAISTSDGRGALVIHHLDGSKPPTVIPADRYEPDWFRWKNGNRLIVALHRVARARTLQTLDVETRLMAIDADGFNNVDLGKGRELRFAEPGNHIFKVLGHRQIESRVIDMLPDDPKHILLELGSPDGLNVERTDIDTGAGDIVELGKHELAGWITDRTGAPRIWIGLHDTLRFVNVRDSASGDWHEIERTDVNLGTPMRPISFSSDPNIFYAEAVSPTGNWGVFEFDISKKAFGRCVACLPDRDVEIVRRDGQFVGYIMPGDHPGMERTVYLDQAWEHDIESINHALPGTTNLIIDRTPSGKRLLVFSRGPQEPGAYYVLDRNGPKPTMDLLAERYPDVDADQVFPVKSIDYRSRDGLVIHGYVVLPKNAGSKPLPFVVLPHGGPTARDNSYFDYWTQFLASRGYGVMLLNGRGSTGFGAKFEQAGLQQWGLAMQGDITDGTKWLVDQKLADANRICIMGGGYGGYAALMGVVTEPNLYRCAISVDGIPDLSAYAFNRRLFSGLNASLARFDNGKLPETSPVNHVDQIKAPVLLLHARMDWTIPVEQTEAMESALKHAGKSVEALYFDDDQGQTIAAYDDGFGGYFNENDNLLSTEADRVAFLKATEAFLKKNIGP